MSTWAVTHGLISHIAIVDKKEVDIDELPEQGELNGGNSLADRNSSNPLDCGHESS